MDIVRAVGVPVERPRYSVVHRRFFVDLKPDDVPILSACDVQKCEVPKEMRKTAKYGRNSNGVN